MGSGFWAFLSLVFLVAAGIFLALTGYHLAQRPDPVFYYLGYTLELFACAFICIIMYQILHTHEVQSALRKTIRGGK